MQHLLKTIIIIFTIYITTFTQTIEVGKGSYSTVLPSGAVGPQTFSGSPAVPKVSPAFSQPAQTCDYWTSLIFPFYGNSFSNTIYAHPLNYKAISSGLELGYTLSPVFAAQDYLFPMQKQLTVGVEGLNASKTTTEGYGDWTVSANWDDGAQKMIATLGHGLPFAFFTVSGGNAKVSCISNPAIWYNQNGVLGITIEGRHYGIFAPDGSSWSGTMAFSSDLGGKDYFSIALLPDDQLSTLELFRVHAYAFVVDSKVAWEYNEETAELSTSFEYTTELKENVNGNLNETLTALYRHQWLYTENTLTNHEYTSVAGKMKLFQGNKFDTKLTFGGVLPALPDEGDYNPDDLLAMVKTVAGETLPSTGDFKGTYWNGKLIARFAHLVNIADQLGATEERDYFLSEIKKRLEDWLTAGGDQQYVYNSTWKTLTGYPSEFGADNQINDHAFHSGYAIMGAAIVAQYDSAWASQENWGGMVNLLIKDGNNFEREDERFPFLRGMDAYAGHSWASGHGDFGDGNNQESSSEAMNFATAVILWGEITHQKDYRDLGIFLYSTERSAIEQYWFDIDDEVFPASYPYTALGMVWGGKGVHSTWFGANPDFIHGINMLPFNGGSMYLGRHPEYVKTNLNEIINELNGVDPTWKDIIWNYQALIEPENALSQFFADPNYDEEEGESKAHTYHWIGNFKKMGQLDISVTADVPTYSVFKNKSNEKTYVAYNSKSDSVMINFSDGFSMKVPPRSMKSFNTNPGNADAPVVNLITDKTFGKSPLTINFSGSRSFDPNGSELEFYWDFGDGTNASVADTTHQFTELGEHTVVLTVTNQLQFTSKDSTTITVLGNGTPFSGTPIMIPAKIEAENYDKGGEGIAYHDVDPNNIGLAYRPDEGVDLEGANDGGFDVYWMVSGEWLEYTIEVPEDGNYDFMPAVSTVPGFGYFRLLFNNVDVSGKVDVKNSGGWQSWNPILIENVPLKKGIQVMRFEVGTDYQSELKNWLFSLNYIQVRKSTSTGNVDKNIKPEKFVLQQNFPNPFNPTTIIKFSLPDNDIVNLEIFDVLGQKVVTLIENKEFKSGTYEHKFNASDLVSGIYFYKISTSRFADIKKMIILK